MADTHIKIKPVTPRVQYTANGSTTVFPYSFAIFDETDMVVYVDDSIITTGYTVSGAGQTDGGNVTFDSAPVDGTIITLLRNVPIERMTDFQEGGTFRPKNINDEFDRQTAFAQQVQEALSRCVKVDPTSESNPEEILPKIERLYDSADNIDIVANDKANVDAVAGNQTNIDAVAGNENNINTVAGISSDVSTVAGNTTDISNVATNMSDVNHCADNIAAIQAAPTAATNAATSAEQAAISAAGTRFKLFHHDWFDYQLNDMAWLRADTFSWQDGTVYSDAYNHLINDLQNIVETPSIQINSTNSDYTNGDIFYRDLSLDTNYYGWSNGTQNLWTSSETPSSSAVVYASGEAPFIPVRDVVVDSYRQKLINTETVGSYTIAYYLADDGHKIVMPNQETTVTNIYNESGVAWYYILDTTNQRFKLPRENPAREELIQIIKAKGNGKTLGLTDGTYNVGLGYSGGSSNPFFMQYDSAYGQNVGYITPVASRANGASFGITLDASKSGIISSMTDSTSVYKGKKYLYFYVGQFSQTATEQTAGLNAELFNGKVDLNAANLSTAGKSLISGLGLPSSKYDNLTLGATGTTYTAPANGWFYISKGGTNGSQYVYMHNDNYGICLNNMASTGSTFIFPVIKGDVVTIDYTSTGTTYEFRFIYAEGDK